MPMANETLTNGRQKIAILIDGDNAQSSLLPQMLVEAGRHGQVTVRRITRRVDLGLDLERAGDEGVEAELDGDRASRRERGEHARGPSPDRAGAAGGGRRDVRKRAFVDRDEVEGI